MTKGVMVLNVEFLLGESNTKNLWGCRTAAAEYDPCSLCGVMGYKRWFLVVFWEILMFAYTFSFYSPFTGYLLLVC